MSGPGAWVLAGLCILALPTARLAQSPVAGEVRQIVTFTFLPGKSAEAVAIYRDQAVPLYAEDPAMLSFRAFREVESPIPLDLMAVSAFEGMAGMDRSNAALRELARAAGTSIGAIYGGIAARSSGHTDQFVRMLPALGTGDGSARRLTAFVWYRVVPDQTDAFEAALAGLVSWELAASLPSATGKFLVSDGWHYLRFLGFDSLAEYEDYWSGAGREGGYGRIEALTAQRREVLVALVPEMSVR